MHCDISPASPRYQYLQHRFIIFIHQNNHPLPCLLECFLNYPIKAFFRCTVCIRGIIFLLPLFQMLVQLLQQRFFFVVFPGIKIQMQNRVFRSIFLQLLYSQALKQLLLSLKIDFQSRNKQTLPKATGTAQKIISTGIS